MIKQNFYGKNIYIDEGLTTQTILGKISGIKNRTKSFVQSIRKVKQNVLNKAKSVIRGTRRTIGVGIKIASLAPHTTGYVLRNIHKGIVATNRYVSKLNLISKNMQQKASNIIKHGVKFYKSNSKIGKIYGGGAIATGKIIHGVGSAIRIPALATNAIKNISQGTIKPLGQLYTKYGDILFKIGNKIDAVKHKNVSHFIGISNPTQKLKNKK